MCTCWCFYLASFFCFLIDFAAFFSFFSKFFVWASSFWSLSVLLLWPGGAGFGNGMCLRAGSSVKASFEFPGTWVFLGRTLVEDSSCLCEMLGSGPAWGGWMGQGKTSQSKCMCAGTWARDWCWETEEPGTVCGLEAGGQALWASLVSGWEEVMCEWEALRKGSGGWITCGCYRQWKEKGWENYSRNVE